MIRIKSLIGIFLIFPMNFHKLSIFSFFFFIVYSGIFLDKQYK